VEALVSRRRSRALLGAGYLGLCAGLAAAALFPESSGPWWFWSLVLVTMPVGPVVVVLQYVAGAFVLDPAQDGWGESALLFLVWMGAAAAQLMAVLVATKDDERPARG
jgi:peptidoglycan/LPS O-acetylase OafA/YrhL